MVILSFYTVYVLHAVLMAIQGTTASRVYTLHGGTMSTASGGNSLRLVKVSLGHFLGPLREQGQGQAEIILLVPPIVCLTTQPTLFFVLQNLR